MTHPFYAGDAVTIWRGNALALPIPDRSVDLIVTSPPYFGLRSYTDDGEHYAGQLGDEATLGEFVDALIAATREMVRVLKRTGSIWINLGDKYARPGGGADRGERSLDGAGLGATARRPTPTAAYGGIPEKSLMGIPWRYALRCIDDLGLILRVEQIWSKLNGLPESVTDRTRRSHEQWFHFTKEPRYFSAMDEIRDEYSSETATRYASGYKRTGASAAGQSANGVLRKDAGGPQDINPLGKLPGSVWEIPTQPLIAPWGYGVENGRVARHFTDEQDALGWLRLGSRAERRRIRSLPDHFAAFPMEWPRRLIRGWSPSGICLACGEGRGPVIEKSLRHKQFVTQQHRERMRIGVAHGRSGRADYYDELGSTEARILGYACACDAPNAATRPAIVLDPFGGTGTTALVARSLGRIGWHVDLSADYCRLARWRVTDPGELARALEVRKPPPVPAGADALFDLEGA